MRTNKAKHPNSCGADWAKASVIGRSTVALGLLFSATAPAANHIVTALPNMTFSPKTMTINAGDTVTFTNGGGFHNVASDPGAVTAFRCADGCDGAGGNGSLSSSAWSATVTFPTAGAAAFHCEAHGAAGGVGMSGKITIQPVATPSPRRSDFDGDGKSDILWRNGATGANAIWKSANSATTQAIASVSTVWKAAGVGDFNGDGKADILWRNSSSGANSIWKSGSSTTPQAVASQINPAWIVPGIGDFDGDGKADILWRNGTTGANAIWKSANSATTQAIASVSTVWKAAGVGDFNGDRKSDILWRNSSTGANSIWKSGSSATPQTVTTMPDLAWQVAGIGDFDGDGKADILWRNGTTGANAIWKSANSATTQAVASVSTVWKAAGVGDFNGDGKSDILWRNSSTGVNTIWKSGSSGSGQAVTAMADQAWQVAGMAP